MATSPVLLIGGAGLAWWLWNTYGADALAAVTTPHPANAGVVPVAGVATPAPVVISTHTQPVTPVTPAPPAPPPPAANLNVNFSQYLANLLGPGRRMLGADAWNFHYANWSGVGQSTDLFTPGNREEEIGLSEYLARRAAKGLSGLLGAPGFIPVGNYTYRGGR